MRMNVRPDPTAGTDFSVLGNRHPGKRLLAPGRVVQHNHTVEAREVDLTDREFTWIHDKPLESLRFRGCISYLNAVTGKTMLDTDAMHRNLA